MARAYLRGEALTRDASRHIAPDNFVVQVRKGLGERVWVQLRGAWMDDLDEPGPNEVALDSRTLVDAAAGWRVLKSVELQLLVRNAFDETYLLTPDRRSPPAPGTSAGSRALSLEPGLRRPPCRLSSTMTSRPFASSEVPPCPGSARGLAVSQTFADWMRTKRRVCGCARLDTPFLAPCCDLDSLRPRLGEDAAAGSVRDELRVWWGRRGGPIEDLSRAPAGRWRGIGSLVVAWPCAVRPARVRVSSRALTTLWSEPAAPGLGVLRAAPVLSWAGQPFSCCLPAASARSAPCPIVWACGPTQPASLRVWARVSRCDLQVLPTQSR